MSPKRSGSPKRKKRALGRGLDALIPDIASMETVEDVPGSNKYLECDTDLIQSNRYQPRLRFNDAELEQLAESIRSQGVLQPLLVRRLETGYELVAGERRLRASRLAGLGKVPVVLKDVSNAEMLEMAIVENIQREDLNPMEEADAYHRLISESGLTQEQASVRVGKSRSAVANFLRLRHLPSLIKESIRQGQLSMGHARALLGVDTAIEQNAAWRQIMSKSLSVRQTEALIKRMRMADGEAAPKEVTSEDRYLTHLAESLSRRFGTKVEIKRRGRRGKLEIEFYSDDDLDRLLQLLDAAS